MNEGGVWKSAECIVNKGLLFEELDLGVGVGGKGWIGKKAERRDVRVPR